MQEKEEQLYLNYLINNISKKIQNISDGDS